MNTDLAGKLISIDQCRVKVVQKLSDQYPPGSKNPLGQLYKVQRLSDMKILNLVIMVKSQRARQHTDLSSHLTPHPNIVEQIAYQESGQSVYILQEATNQNLYEAIVHMAQTEHKQGFTEEQALSVISDIVQGLLHIHMSEPSVAFRDLNIFNVIRGSDNKWKLLNLGNSTTKFYLQIYAYERVQIDEEIENCSDQLFRAPELLDLYSDYPITEKMDVFSLGCVLYYLLFFKSAFNSDLKLDQMNSRYVVPAQKTPSEGVSNLLARMLVADPIKRISCAEIWSVIDSLKEQLTRPQLDQSPTAVANLPLQTQLFQQSQSEIGGIIANYCNISDKASSERQFRTMVIQVTQQNTRQELLNLLHQRLQAQPPITTAALKTLSLIHRCSLYLPNDPTFYESMLQNSNGDLGYFKKLWSDIEENKTKNAQDQFRCVYFSKLLEQYADTLIQKFTLIKDYSSVLEGGGYSLRRSGLQKQLGGGNSPLNVHLLSQLLKIWQSMQQLASKLLTKPLYLWELRLQILINLIEDQSCLASLLLHLIVTFKSVYTNYQSQGTQMPDSIPSFIQSFDETYAQNQLNLLHLINKAKNFAELQHLKHKWPQFDFTHTNCPPQQQYNSSQLLTPVLQIQGVYLPVAFRLYKTFVTMSDENYELTLAYPQYRQSLTQQIQRSQQTELEQFMPTNSMQTVFSQHATSIPLPQPVMQNQMSISLPKPSASAALQANALTDDQMKNVMGVFDNYATKPTTHSFIQPSSYQSNLLDMKQPPPDKQLQDVDFGNDELEEMMTRKASIVVPQIQVEKIAPAQLAQKREQDEPVNGVQTTTPSWLQSDLDIRKSIIDNKLIASESQFDQTMKDKRHSLKMMQKKNSSDREIYEKQIEVEELKVKHEHDQQRLQSQRQELAQMNSQLQVQQQTFQQEKELTQKLFDEQRRLLEQERQRLENLKLQLDQQPQNVALQQQFAHLPQHPNQQPQFQCNLAQMDFSILEKQSLNQKAQEPRTDLQQADDFLNQEFKKGQDFFRINLGDLMFEKIIGTGASAEVYKGSYKEMDVAIKKLRFQVEMYGPQNPIKEFKREVSTLLKVRHPNLVLFVGACADKGHVMIVTEYCFGGSLFSLLHEKRSVHLSNKQKFKIALDIAKGMNYLHTSDQKGPILHRDLKSLNLLVVEPINSQTDFVQIKITDFGLSRAISGLSEGTDFQSQQSSRGGRMTGLAGTFHWMAPEVLQSEEYTHKADVYSYGIVLWEVLCREPPFSKWKPHEIITKVVSQQARPDMSKIPPDTPKEMVFVMKKCWEQDPHQRPEFKDVVKALKQIHDRNLII